MPDPIDISTFPRAFDPADFTPREAEAYDEAWSVRRDAVRRLTAALRCDDVADLSDALGEAMASVARCSAIEDAATERIRMEADHAEAAPYVPLDWRRALVIGPRVDGDRASENDLAQRGAYDHLADALDHLADEFDAAASGRGSTSTDAALLDKALAVVEAWRGIPR